MPIPADQKHRVLREAFRHYTDFKDFVARTGQDTLEYQGVTLSFAQLSMTLKEEFPKLAKRKRQAFYLNVLLDLKQRDVAEKMSITTVSVGQYVEAACEQLAVKYFAEDESYKMSNSKGK